MPWIKSFTKLPVVLKGILTAEDARLAVQHGADGIVVSNHGGRQLDGVLATVRINDHSNIFQTIVIRKLSFVPINFISIFGHVLPCLEVGGFHFVDFPAFKSQIVE